VDFFLLRYRASQQQHCGILWTFGKPRRCHWCLRAWTLNSRPSYCLLNNLGPVKFPPKNFSLRPIEYLDICMEH
jgi:hypothetical protein